MRLLRVQTAGFRNLVSGTIEVNAPNVVFCGPNGQGKTNWLEAIGILGTLRSFRTARTPELLLHGAIEASVEGVAESDGLTRRFRWGWREGVRQITREDRAIDAVAWLRSLRAAYFVPSDVGQVRGEPALRRAMLDRAALTIEPSYLSVAQGLRRVIEQKAALLRSGNADGPLLDAVDAQLAGLAVRVVARRAETVAVMEPHFRRFHAAFASSEEARVRYRPSLEGDVDSVMQKLAAARPAERQLRRLQVGPQRDDLDFGLSGRSARQYASQGQARSIVLSWKLAELASARGEGETPLFLVDDLGSELDPDRTARLVRTLGTLGAQVFMTTTDRRFLPEGLADTLVFDVAAGVARPG